MTITYLGEVHAPASSARGIISLTRSFKLQTSVKTERAYHVGSHPSLPAVGSVHPDLSAWCRTLSVDPSDPWRGWTATAEYDTEFPMAEVATDEAARIQWNSEQFQRPAIFDAAGAAIVNSAGDPFDPPNMMDDSRRVVTITKNLAVVPAWILTYQDAVNSDSFTLDGVTIGIGLAKIQSVTVSEVQNRNSAAFRTVTFTMHLQKNGWLLEPLDAGFRQIASGARENIRNSGDDELPAAPVPLDGLGAVLADPSLTNNVFLSFVVYESLTFASLPLT